MAFESITKTYIRKPGEEPEIVKKDNQPVKQKSLSPDKQKKRKFKLRFLGVSLSLVGGATTAALLFGSVKIAKYEINRKKEEKLYTDLKNDDHIRTASVLDLVDHSRTSVDELLESDLVKYNEYEKYRTLVNLRSRYITPKLNHIQKYQPYDIDVDDISFDRVQYLSDTYHNIKIELGDDKCESNEEYIEVCKELNSMYEAINKYEAAYGKDLVVNMAENVLASKVVDAKQLNPDNVSNIQSKYNEKGKLSVSFDYNYKGQVTNYTTTFKDDIAVRPGEIATDLSQGELQKAIQDTNILAYSEDYNNMIINEKMR